MCTLKQHICKVCGQPYDCDQPNWACSSINDDEDGFLCPKDEAVLSEEMRIAYGEMEKTDASAS